VRQIVSVLLVVCVCEAFAQDSMHFTEGFDRNPDFAGRKVLATGMVGGLIIFSLAWSYDAWWKDNRSPFTFYSDGWFSGAKLSGRFRRNQVKGSASKCKHSKHFN